MRFRGKRLVTPLYQHMQHATKPTLGFVGIQLSVPCPIPFFECQAAYLAEAWARKSKAVVRQAQKEDKPRELIMKQALVDYANALLIVDWQAEQVEQRRAAELRKKQHGIELPPAGTPAAAALGLE